MTEQIKDIGVVAIGRNEGERLKRCLNSVTAQSVPVIYVDSGSTDGSLAFAESIGVPVVTLDMSIPFTAARARNAGYEKLVELHPDLTFVQFIDGDCGLNADWLAKGRAALMADNTLGIVTGWRSEIHADASVYNAICDYEWHAPAGPIDACGGDMLVRRTACDAAGGFNDTVIAAEDDEFCIRVREAGFTLLRLPEDMTAHDADIHSFGQWWKRAERAGHGFAQVGDMHDGYFAAPRKRVIVYGIVLPALALLGLLFSSLLLLAVLAVYALSYVKSTLNLRQGPFALPQKEALHHAVFMVLSKFPNAIGFIKYYLRRSQGRDMRIIEYK